MSPSAARALTLLCKQRCSSAVREAHLADATRRAESRATAGELSAAYRDVLLAAPVLDGRVFVEIFARGRMSAAEERWLARAAWRAAAYISGCADEAAAVSCLLDTGAWHFASFRAVRH
jgi:hypothetical protein